MKSIEELEKLISKYEFDWGISDGFGNEFKLYQRGDKHSRINTATWFLGRNPKRIYKKEIIRVAVELGLIS